MTNCAHAMPESRRWQVTRKFQLFVSGPFGFARELNVWNITTGVAAPPTHPPGVPGGGGRGGARAQHTGGRRAIGREKQRAASGQACSTNGVPEIARTRVGGGVSIGVEQEVQVRIREL